VGHFFPVTRGGYDALVSTNKMPGQRRAPTMTNSKLPTFKWFAALCLAGVCSSLAWIALTELRLAGGPRVPISRMEAVATVVAAFIWLGGVLAVVGGLAMQHRYGRLIQLALAAAWCGSVAAYLAWA
jgi:hypothetical protein